MYVSSETLILSERVVIYKIFVCCAPELCSTQSTRVNCMFVVLLLASFSSLLSGDVVHPVAKFPLQISAVVTITAHLVEEASAYPPRERSMKINYDYIGQT